MAILHSDGTPILTTQAVKTYQAEYDRITMSTPNQEFKSPADERASPETPPVREGHMTKPFFNHSTTSSTYHHDSKGNSTQETRTMRSPPPAPTVTEPKSTELRKLILKNTTWTPTTNKVYKTSGDGRPALPSQARALHQAAPWSISTLRRHPVHTQYLEPERILTTLK